jgi:hypothetical protein
VIDSNTSIIIYAYICMYMQNVFAKVGLLEETEGEGKEERNVRE